MSSCPGWQLTPKEPLSPGVGETSPTKGDALFGPSPGMLVQFKQGRRQDQHVLFEQQQQHAEHLHPWQVEREQAEA